jgi:hypothetical protein
MLEGIHRLIDAAESKPANFPATLLYNEGWMLRLVLDWYSSHKLTSHPLKFQPRASPHASPLPGICVRGGGEIMIKFRII